MALIDGLFEMVNADTSNGRCGLMGLPTVAPLSLRTSGLADI